jgi:carboxypeptidase T
LTSRATRWASSLLLTAAAAAACTPNQLPGIRPGALQSTIFTAPERAQASLPVYRITPKAPTDIDTLSQKGMDIFSVRKGVVEGRVSDEALAFAKERGLTLTAMRDVSDARGQGLPAGFMTYNAIVARLQAIATANPNLATLVDLGSSWQSQQGQGSRRILALRLTNGSNRGPKPKALFTAGHHSRELAPPEIAMRLIEELVGEYGKDATITKLMDTREAWVVPVLNPDGRVDVEGGNAMWRKNRHQFSRSIGVDLNRNYDSHFSDGDENPNSETYHGEAAFSEPEIHGLRDLYGKEKFSVSMDWHAYAGAVIWPPGWNRGNTPDQATFARIGKAITAKNGYDADTIARRFYLAPGSICDWAYEKHGVMAFCAEMGTSFRPTATELPKLYAENRDGALHLLTIADNPKAAR